MGNWCCPPANPCDSVEERSGLLQQDASKAPAHTAETGVLGAYQDSPETEVLGAYLDSPEAEVHEKKSSDEAGITEEVKVVTDQVKPSPRAGETHPAQTQENGPVREERQQTEAPPPGEGTGLDDADSSITAQDKNAEDTATDNGPVERLHCTLESPRTECATDLQVSTEVKVLAETKEVVGEGVLATAEDRVSQESDEEPPAPLGAEVTAEHVTPETLGDHGDKDEDGPSEVTVGSAVDTPSEDPSVCNDVSLSLPDSPLRAETCQVSSSVCGHETSTEDHPPPPSVSPSSTVTKELGLENGSDHVKERRLDDFPVKSHDAPEPSSSSGADATPPRNHDDTEPAVGEPVSTGPAAASESLNSGEHSKADLRSPPTASSEVTSPENLARGIVAEETESRVKGEDVAPKTKEGSEAEEETEPRVKGEDVTRKTKEDSVAEEETESRVKGEDVAPKTKEDSEAEVETGLRVKGEDVAPKTKEDGETEEEMTRVAASEVPVEAEREGEMPELDNRDDQAASAVVEVEVIPVREQEEEQEECCGNSDEDLYRGAEELTSNQVEKAGPVPLFEITLPKVENRCSLAPAVDILSYSEREDRCSLAPAVDILSYSEREWKGNTAKSILIRKGYKEMSQRFVSLRRVRGDNYCALRATLFQLLSTSTQLPSWLQQEDTTMLPKELEAQEGLISQWTFPGECQQGEGDATQQLKRYMELLRNRWQAAVACGSGEERQRLCERVFRGGEEELGLLEALKLLMLGRAVELHAAMQAGGDVPVFCWLLFARDSSECPRAFLSNHLSRVGFSGGLEQVEMFLLGHALQCTIQVYRLYMAETEEFVTYYPDDHKDDWPSVWLVTEDDRHYNVPVGDAADLLEDLVEDLAEDLTEDLVEDPLEDLVSS